MPNAVITLDLGNANFEGGIPSFAAESLGLLMF